MCSTALTFFVSTDVRFNVTVRVVLVAVVVIVVVVVVSVATVVLPQLSYGAADDRFFIRQPAASMAANVVRQQNLLDVLHFRIQLLYHLPILVHNAITNMVTVVRPPWSIQLSFLVDVNDFDFPTRFGVQHESSDSFHESPGSLHSRFLVVVKELQSMRHGIFMRCHFNVCISIFVRHNQSNAPGFVLPHITSSSVPDNQVIGQRRPIEPVLSQGALLGCVCSQQFLDGFFERVWNGRVEFFQYRCRKIGE